MWFNSSYFRTCVLNKEPYNTLVTVVGFFHGFVRNKGKISQVYKTSASMKLVHTKQTMLNFFIRNEQSFPLLSEANNTLRVVRGTYFYSDHHLHGVIGNKHRFGDKDFSTLLLIYSQKVCSFKYLFLWATWLLCLGDMTKISGDMTKVPPHLTWGEMTSRQRDQLPMGIVNK